MQLHLLLFGLLLCARVSARVSNAIDAPDDAPAMVAAAARGEVAVLEQWVAAGGDLNARDAREHSALMASSVKGQEAVVRYLVGNASCELDLTNRMGVTALMAAAKVNHRPIARLLLRAGARADLRSDYGTAMEIALRKHAVEVASCLREHELQRGDCAAQRSPSRPGQHSPSSADSAPVSRAGWQQVLLLVATAIGLFAKVRMHFAGGDAVPRRGGGSKARPGLPPRQQLQRPPRAKDVAEAASATGAPRAAAAAHAAKAEPVGGQPPSSAETLADRGGAEWLVVAGRGSRQAGGQRRRGWGGGGGTDVETCSSSSGSSFGCYGSCAGSGKGSFADPLSGGGGGGGGGGSCGGGDGGGLSKFFSASLLNQVMPPMPTQGGAAPPTSAAPKQLQPSAEQQDCGSGWTLRDCGWTLNDWEAQESQSAESPSERAHRARRPSSSWC